VSKLIRILAAALVAASAAPALASNDRPPADDDPQPRATWTFDLPSEQPVPNDDATYAVAPPEAGRSAPGPAFALIPLPPGDGSPGDAVDSLEPASGAANEATAHLPTPTGACSGNC